MQPFKYEFAQDQSAAVRAISSPVGNTKLLAGGTTLVDLMKLHVETPDVLIDINDLPLSRIVSMPYGGVRIGAMVRNSDCANSSIIKEQYPVLSEALLSGASPQLRNAATTGGNLLQRTRCYYFRDSSQPCNKRQPGSGCPAIDGFNRIHAVLGTSKHCIATHPSDMCVALTALDATIVVVSSKSERSIPIDQFYLVPGDHPERENVLRPDELITAVELPPKSLTVTSTYIKVRDRASYAFALASAAVVLHMDSTGKIGDARIVLGGVATKPWRAYDAEKQLLGAVPSRDLFLHAAEAAVRGAKGYHDNEFKIELAKRVIVRALTKVSATIA